jgi:hypothetical protein
MTERHIAFTNKKRMEINKLMMDQTITNKKFKALELPGLEYDPNSQNVKLCTGMPVIARKNSKQLQIFNNETFTIKEIKRTEDEIIVEDEGRERTVPISEFTKIFPEIFQASSEEKGGKNF